MNVSQLNEQLNHVALADRKKLPPVAAIYFILDPTGQIMYVGKTTNLRQRWEQHHKLQQARANGCSLAWFSVSETIIDGLERDLIQECNPIWNDIRSEGNQKTRITLYVLADLWMRFRIACIARNVSASEVLEDVMRKQLARWEQDK